MPERKPYDELDDTVEALMNDRNVPPDLSPGVAGVVRMAEHLLDLPDPGFRRRLKAALLASADTAPLSLRVIAGIEPGEIARALQEMDGRDRFTAYDLESAAHGLPELAMRFLARMNQCVLGVSRFSSHSHWERHPGADELLYLIEGQMDVTTLTADGPVVSNVRQGAAFICPRGLWHRIDPCTPVAMLFATPGEGTVHSDAERPQQPAAAPLPMASSVGPPHDVRGGLAAARLFDISASTTEAEADAAFRELFSFNECAVNVGSFRGLTPWERHSKGDELLHVLDGEVEITVLTDAGPVQRNIHEGSIFVCPQGLWHRQLAKETVTGLFATPRPTEVSWATDPRI